MQFSGLSTILLLSMSSLISAAAVPTQVSTDIESVLIEAAQVLESLGEIRGDDGEVDTEEFESFEFEDVEEDITSLEKRAESKKAATDRLLFSSSMATFKTAKKNKKPANLIWTDDGCSWSPDKPAGFNFQPTCQRHDFGYRNYKKQSRFTAAARLRIDNRWRSDMYNVCAPYGAVKKAACRKLADTYYAVVRKVGK